MGYLVYHHTCGICATQLTLTHQNVLHIYIYTYIVYTVITIYRPCVNLRSVEFYVFICDAFIFTKVRDKFTRA